MGTFELVRSVPAGIHETFGVFAAFRDHGDFIPLTTITSDEGPIGVNWTFTARSGFGPLALPDRMEVSIWDPPHEFRIDKLGPVLDGWAHVHFAREGSDTRVVWREHIMVRPHTVGRVLGRVLDPGNQLMFGRALDKMARRAAEAPGSTGADGP